ncbi:hypothetical protein K438DRAFT_2026156 [Mycena galopus ATCC 62051]|nr:hypothetical protein K438DRAFT_2026156 [Mycena galopus ATCC 62051]
MSSTPQDPNALADRTNTSGKGRSGKTTTGPVKSRRKVDTTHEEGDGDDNGLQTAIPGARSAPKKKAKQVNVAGDAVGQNGATGAGSADNTELVANLLARIAALEGAKGQSTPPAKVPARRAPLAPATQRTPAAPRTPSSGGTPNITEEATKPLKMIAKPAKEVGIQVGMRLARSQEGDLLYKTARSTVQDCIKRADMDIAVPWDKQPLEKRLLVINAAKGKVKYLQRMENDWATHMLARQYLKNKRNTAYRNGSLGRPEGFGHLKHNAALRTISGSRVKKAKLVLEARLAKRALEDKEDEAVERPRKKARASDANQRPQFVEGSSRDGEREGLNEWDAHPQRDDEYLPEGEDDAERYEMDQDSQANDSDIDDD